MNCTGCQNYDNCEKRDDSNMVICFKKYPSICYYCNKRNDCEDVFHEPIDCSDFEMEVGL